LSRYKDYCPSCYNYILKKRKELKEYREKKLLYEILFWLPGVLGLIIPLVIWNELIIMAIIFLVTIALFWCGTKMAEIYSRWLKKKLGLR